MFDASIRRASLLYDVPEAWIRAVIQTESSFDPNAYRAEPQINDASYGLMQLLERTARGLGFIGPVSDLYDPDINIDLGTMLLADLRARYGDDFRRIYSAYNSGRPDLYLTSSQVASNVARAMAALERWTTAVIDVLPPLPPTGEGLGTLTGFLVLGALIWLLRR